METRKPLSVVLETLFNDKPVPESLFDDLPPEVNQHTCGGYFNKEKLEFILRCHGWLKVRDIWTRGYIDDPEIMTVVYDAMGNAHINTYSSKEIEFTALSSLPECETYKYPTTPDDWLLVASADDFKEGFGHSLASDLTSIFFEVKEFDSSSASFLGSVRKYNLLVQDHAVVFLSKHDNGTKVFVERIVTAHWRTVHVSLFVKVIAPKYVNVNMDEVREDVEKYIIESTSDGAVLKGFNSFGSFVIINPKPKPVVNPITEVEVKNHYGMLAVHTGPEFDMDKEYPKKSYWDRFINFVKNI